MATLITIPEDALLLIIDLLEPEELLCLVQAFWLAGAKALQRRRRVHYLPLEELDLPQLRRAVFHTLRLELKWSGRENIDPSPLRCVQITPLSHTTARPPEKQAVTWVWFLEDGLHLTCVIDDEIVQLWNLPRNEPILTFDVCGTLVRASQYSEKDHFVIAASIDVRDGPMEEDVRPMFVVWKYRWDNTGITEGLQPCASHALPAHPTSICLTGGIAGAVYATDAPEGISSNIEKDKLGYLTFLLVEWKGSCIFQRRYTPLNFFGAVHAEQWRNEMAHCVRNTSHFFVIFESTMTVEVYAYDWNLFENEFVIPKADIPGGDMLYPRLKVTYALGSEHSPGWFSHRMRHSWSQPCLLWDGLKIGILGYFVSLETHRAFITLSVIDLVPIMTHNKAGSNYDLQEQYKRRFIDNGSAGQSSYTTTGNRFLGSQPRYATNTTWALRHSDKPNIIAGLALSHFFPEPALEAEARTDQPTPVVDNADGGADVGAPDESTVEHRDTELKPQQRILQIKLPPSLPVTERAEDVDLDDRLGKVAFGMESGNVFILEFV